MATVGDDYRIRIQELLKQYASQPPSAHEIEMQTIFDTKNDHYQLVKVGWLNNHRIYGCVLHLDIKGDKIWIQHNGTEIPIAEELVALGIPKDHIVIGFHSPPMRLLTEYAAN